MASSPIKKDIKKFTIKDAEVYTSQGLYDEALNIYEKILSDGSELAAEIINKIKEKVNWLRQEIKIFDRDTAEVLSSEDLSLISKTQIGEGSIPEILDGASAFKELRMFKEAVAEYEKLIQKKYPAYKVVPNVIECLLEIHPPSRVIDKVENVLNRVRMNPKDIAEIKFNLGQEIEKRGYADLALELYESSKRLDPDNKKIDFFIDTVKSQRTYGSRYEYLIEIKKITIQQLQGALVQSKKMSKSVEFALMEQFNISKEEIGKSLTAFYKKSSFKSYESNYPLQYELSKKVKKPFLLKEFWLPLSWDLDTIEVLMENPNDIKKIDEIKAIFKAKNVKICVGIKEDIELFIKDFFDENRIPAQETNDQAVTFSKEEHLDLVLPEIEFEEIEEKKEKVAEDTGDSSSQVVRTVDQILISAYRKNVSDIHIEPSPVTKKTRVRFRIDGVCQEVMQFPNSITIGIISRLKIMAGLNIAEKRLPQDGKIKFLRKNIKPFELRLATLPTAGGLEDAVLRILASAGAMNLDDMGLSERNLNVLKKIITQPYGLVLVVGPTGSGKTTTLHSALGYINKPSTKIWTAEDPVEITQQGLRQVQANSEIGLNFARIMRAFLRADPDVIMIGEMRDHETASIGVEASLTGHLVLSTLHTNSAPETVTRLLDMGLNPLNFSDAFLGVLAQRLSRKLCKKCKTQYNPPMEEFDEIVSYYGKKYFDKTGITYTKDLMIYKPVGCFECGSNGYKGRLGIHELMEGTKEIKKLIKKSAPTEELFEYGIKEGMATLKQDGILKVFQGLTDIKEIRRVAI